MNISLKSYARTNEEVIQLDKQIQIIEQLEKQLEKHFDFKIPKYIIVDIAENETYNHICLMINLATVNERLSIEHSVTLKQGLKELLNIENEYAKVESKIILE